ncbi:hypothetical protein ACTI_34700 [Actinoplanes sp. OR16]|uniref:hypothetical protein n=1 Tax=Actinoplanes sp. OR16 TaxID=946334 RepID=UPI000F6DE921|nr:hypothetical protein [Actinoplanes sp. OR16]BBH66785.1 hypothetical protein ACTI_34700 [Actinoplanes sp. OR16]
MGTENPYPEQTSANAAAPWLRGGPAIAVDLDGLREYARLLASQQADISARSGYLAPLGEMPVRAFSGDVLGEADAVRAGLQANAAELSTYLGKLAESLGNVANAAQTIAESYRSSDAASAASLASLDDVLFAFGDKTVPRPAGLPDELGATYLDQQMAGTAAPPAADSALWQDGPVTAVSAYQTLQISNGPNGERREVSTVTPPGGVATTTTTIFGRGGETISASTTRTSSRFDGPVRTTTVETFGTDGTLTATTKTTISYDGPNITEQSTETVDAEGRTTSLTTEKVDPVTRESTTSTYRPGESGVLEETNRVTTGTRTSGPLANG